MLRHVAAGLPRIGKDEQQRRESLCRECKHQYMGKCLLCGCGTEGRIMNKTLYPLEQCPAGPGKCDCHKEPVWLAIPPTGWRKFLLAMLAPALKRLCG